MEKVNLLIGNYPISIFLPASHGQCSTIIYSHLTEDVAESIAKQNQDAYILAAITGVDWNNDLSPWPAPKAFREGDDFAGGADSYLKTLTTDMVPAVEAKIGLAFSFRAIAGYSLAGLFAVYALYRTDVFDSAASMSGSLWYDGFLEYMAKNRPVRVPRKVYFSLGDREGNTHNPRFAKIQDCTAKAESLLQSCGAATKFELNEGNHFVDVPERMAKGMSWISEDDCYKMNRSRLTP